MFLPCNNELVCRHFAESKSKLITTQHRLDTTLDNEFVSIKSIKVVLLVFIINNNVLKRTVFR